MRGKILIQGSLVRAAYGVSAVFFPKLVFAMIGSQENPDARYVNRLFGGRDLLVAGQTALAVRGGSTRGATAVNFISEATDTVALVQELKDRGKLDRTLAVGLAFNVFGYITWTRALFGGTTAALEAADQLGADTASAIGDGAAQTEKRLRRSRRRAAKRLAEAESQASDQLSKASAVAHDLPAKASKKAEKLQKRASKRADKFQKQADELQKQAAKRAEKIQKQADELQKQASRKAKAAAKAAQAA